MNELTIIASAKVAIATRFDDDASEPGARAARYRDMIGRRAFVASAVAFVATAMPRAGGAVETPDTGTRRSADGRLALDAVDVLIATLPRVRTVWKVPAALPPLIPIAYYAGRGGDPAHPNDPAIWLNPDHPELVSPRRSRLTDEIPLSAELLLAAVDARSPGVAALGLDELDPEPRRLAAGALAARVAVVTRYTPYPAVDDAEFARRAFAFAVLRQMTPEIGGVETLPPPAALPAGEGAVYAGRDDDRRAPHGWGVVYADLERGGRDRRPVGRPARVRRALRRPGAGAARQVGGPMMVSDDRSTVASRRRAFRALHDGPAILVLPNAWDVISARVYEDAGFPAVATSSAGLANSLGYSDGNVLDVDLHLATLERLTRALDVPLSADVESGYAADTASLVAFVRRLAATGVAGYNLEDVKAEGELFELDEARERVRAAHDAAPEMFLNARTDVYLARVGAENTRFERTVERLHAFAEAGADGVFVPGVADAETIGRLAAATPRPLNVLAGPQVPDAAALQRLGVHRVSVGSSVMRRTLGVLREIAHELRDHGTFSFTREPSVSYADANALLDRRS